MKEDKIPKPIPTFYNGYYFRSRLEARWAVFFDTANIEYQYEVEGYQTEYGEKYLPDFFLPKTQTWVEVKGDPLAIAKDINKFLRLHYFDGGILPGFNNSNYRLTTSGARGLLLLGNFPQGEIEHTYFHPIIQHDKDGLYKNWITFRDMRDYSRPDIVSNEVLWILFGFHEKSIANLQKSVANSHWLIETIHLKTPFYYPKIDKAYKSAKSARFEHGESGSMTGKVKA